VIRLGRPVGRQSFYGAQAEKLLASDPMVVVHSESA